MHLEISVLFVMTLTKALLLSFPTSWFFELLVPNSTKTQIFGSIDSYYYHSLPFYYSYSFLCSFVTHILLFLFSVLLGSWINFLGLSCTCCDANSWMEVVNSTFHHSRRNFYHFMQGMNGIVLHSLPCASIIDKWIISFIT